MLIDCTTCSNALAGGGDKARETLRSGGFASGEGASSAPDCERASPNASEPDSASLRKPRRPTSQGWRSLQPLVKQQSRAARGPGGVIGESARGKDNRATLRERSPVPGLRSRVRQRGRGNHNHAIGRNERAEGSVVARKRGNARGAKGPCCKRVNIKTVETAWESSPDYGFNKLTRLRWGLCPKAKSASPPLVVVRNIGQRPPPRKLEEEVCRRAESWKSAHSVRRGARRAGPRDWPPRLLYFKRAG
jgi:hypothetical protein